MHEVLVEINGETKRLSEWCEKYGISRGCVYNRVHDKGWTYQDAITTPRMFIREKPVPEGRNNKKQLCKKCLYRGRIGSNMPADLICDYIGRTGHRRPCKAIDCTEFIKGNPKRPAKNSANRFFMTERGKVWK